MADHDTRTAFTVKEVAERWQCKAHTVLAAISSNRLQAFKLNPDSRRPTWRIPLASVLEFEAARSPKPPHRPTRRRSGFPMVSKNYF